MKQIAVFVDAGYFWKQVAQVIVGTDGVRREEVEIDYPALRQQVLQEVKKQFPHGEFLRVYWYDGAGVQGQKTPSHHAIDELDDFKLRLGTRNGYGAQKGVDGLIIADLIGLAHARAVDRVLIVSGDADLIPGIHAVQALGVRAHLLSLGPEQATSADLRAVVDFKARWFDQVVDSFAKAAPRTQEPVAEPLAGSPAEQDVYGEIVARALHEMGHYETPVQLENGSIGKAADGRLLWAGAQHFQRMLTDDEKRALRKAFRKAVTPQPHVRPVENSEAKEVTTPSPLDGVSTASVEAPPESVVAETP